MYDDLANELKPATLDRLARDLERQASRLRRRAADIIAHRRELAELLRRRPPKRPTPMELIRIESKRKMIAAMRLACAGRTDAEIAAELDCSIQWVRVLIKRACAAAVDAEQLEAQMRPVREYTAPPPCASTATTAGTFQPAGTPPPPAAEQFADSGAAVRNVPPRGSAELEQGTIR